MTNLKYSPVNQETAVPVIADVGLLDFVGAHHTDSQPGLLFHGTPKELAYIEPRTCKAWLSGRWLADTKQPVVCASADPTIAAFRAIVPRTQQVFGCRRQRNEEGGLTFLVPEQSRTALYNTVGYVALCDPADFEPYDPRLLNVQTVIREHRSTKPVVPLCNVAVDYTDFEELLHATLGNEVIYT